MSHITHLHIIMSNFYVLQKDLKKREASPYLIGKYRILWLHLSQLAVQTGKYRDIIARKMGYMF